MKDDLINRQAAIEAIDAVFPVDPMKSEYAQGIACGAALAKTYIEQLPSVDAVEVVRCKDCKHFDGECCGRYADETLGYVHSTQLNFFCAVGERKTDG